MEERPAATDLSSEVNSPGRPKSPRTAPDSRKIREIDQDRPAQESDGCPDEMPETIGYELVCLHCGNCFSMCRQCYRGHRYCGEGCRIHGYAQTRKRARRTYARSDEARRDHRERQRRYRQRGRAESVTDQSSETAPPPLPSPENRLEIMTGRACTGRCCRCGRRLDALWRPRR